MPDYKESAVTGNKWNRFSRVVLDNPSGGTPSVLIVEETAIQLGSEIHSRPVGNLSVTFQPGGLIDIYDPTTGLKTGNTLSHEEYYAINYSVCMTAAAARDAVIAPPVE